MLTTAESIEALDEDGNVVIIHILRDRIIVCDDEGLVITDTPLLPGYIEGMYYVQ